MTCSDRAVVFLLGFVVLAATGPAAAGQTPDAQTVYAISVEEAVLLATQAMQSVDYAPVQADAAIGFAQGTHTKKGSPVGALFVGAAAMAGESSYVLDVNVLPVNGGVTLDVWARKAKNMDRSDHRSKDEKKFRLAFEERLRSYRMVAPRTAPAAQPRPPARPPQPMRGVSVLQIESVICNPNPVAAGEALELVIRIHAADPSLPGEKMPLLYHYVISKDGRELHRSEEVVLAALNGYPTAHTEGFVAPSEPGTYRFEITVAYGDHGVTKRYSVEVE